MAGSPIRHESTVQGNPVEVQTYQPPWKTLSDFALQSDLDQPAFQQLVGLHQIHYSPPKMNYRLLEMIQRGWIHSQRDKGKERKHVLSVLFDKRRGLNVRVMMGFI